MALKDDLVNAVNTLNTTSQQVVTAFNALKASAGTVDDPTVKAAVDQINTTTAALAALIPPV